MLFIIEDNKPYLCSGGRVYPVEITEGKVRIDEESGQLSNEKGRYSLQEVVSKLGANVSSIHKRRWEKQEV